MGYRKYVADFTIREEINDRGRVVRTAVYQGPLFAYVLDHGARRRYAIWFSILMLAEWALFITSLLFPLDTMGQFYIMVPYGVRFLPLFFMSMSAFSFLTAKEPLKREQNDGLYLRTSHCLIFLVIFGGIAILAAIVAAIVYRKLSGADIYLLVAMIVQLGLDSIAFLLRKGMKTLELKGK